MPDFWRVRDLAEYWRVDRTTVYKWIDCGLLPATRIGCALRVSSSDAHAFERRELSNVSNLTDTPLSSAAKPPTV